MLPRENAKNESRPKTLGRGKRGKGNRARGVRMNGTVCTKTPEAEDYFWEANLEELGGFPIQRETEASKKKALR